MKKAGMLFLVFIIGLAVGMFGWNFIVETASGSAAGGTLSSPVKNGASSLSPSAGGSGALDRLAVLQLACQAVKDLKQADYHGLAQLIHPEKGVLFAPYSTVDPDVNLTFSAGEIATLANNDRQYIWGFADGSGSIPLKLTIKDYFQRFVFNQDYTQAPEIGINQILQMGNSLENVMQIYPDATVIEFHFPSLNSAQQGMDWCSLKLVFEPFEATYKIVALIHSQWTI